MPTEPFREHDRIRLLAPRRIGVAVLRKVDEVIDWCTGHQLDLLFRILSFLLGVRDSQLLAGPFHIFLQLNRRFWHMFSHESIVFTIVIDVATSILTTIVRLRLLLLLVFIALRPLFLICTRDRSSSKGILRILHGNCSSVCCFMVIAHRSRIVDDIVIIAILSILGSSGSSSSSRIYVNLRIYIDHVILHTRRLRQRLNIFIGGRLQIL